MENMDVMSLIKKSFLINQMMARAVSELNRITERMARVKSKRDMVVRIIETEDVSVETYIRCNDEIAEFDKKFAELVQRKSELEDSLEMYKAAFQF